MADKNLKVPENVHGKFYVDDQCIACDACVMEAPLFFVMNDIEGYAFLKLQPKTKDQLKNCMDALQACPVDAIGSDGDE